MDPQAVDDAQLIRQSSRTFALFVALGVSIGACHRSFLLPPLPSTAQRFTPPPVYETWWSLTAECSGSARSMSAVQWFVIPGVSVFWHEGSLVNGFWSSAGNRIVLAEGAMEDGAVVRHEMLHAQRPGAGHSRDFVERCGGVVVCLSACREGAGHAPDPSPALRRVSPAALQVDVALGPVDPLSDHLMLTVTARNPAPDSVVVPLPPPGDAAPPPGFSFELNNEVVAIRSAGRTWTTAAVFGPGETRRAVFDFRLSTALGGSRGLPPGTYSVRGAFGPQWSAPKSVTVTAAQQQ